MNKNNYEVNVCVNGKPIREYYHNGRFYIEARQNTEYSIKLKNHSHKKIMAVFSVDGIDVLNGKNATDAESGYIINPYSSTEIKGYRIDDDTVATFRFDDGKKSYSTQVEQKFNKKKLEKVARGEIAPSKNNGVIGIRIWEEKEPMVIPEWKTEKYPRKKWFYNNYDINDNPLNCSTSRSILSFSISNNGYAYGGLPSGSNFITGCSNISYTSCVSDSLDNSSLIGSVDGSIEDNILVSRSLQNYTPSFELGTTWGKQEEDKVIKVNFVKAETYIDLEIFYLKREELIKLGIDVENAKKVFISGYPKAFDTRQDYCKEPINWRKR